MCEDGEICYVDYNLLSEKYVVPQDFPFFNYTWDFVYMEHYLKMIRLVCSIGHPSFLLFV